MKKYRIIHVKNVNIMVFVISTLKSDHVARTVFFLNTNTFELGVGTKSREFVTMNCPLLCNSDSDIHRFELRLALLGLT